MCRVKAMIAGLMLLANLSFGQQTITISGADFNDANIYKDLRPGQEYRADTNYGNFSRISAIAWTNSSSQVFWRSLLYFNLQAIPSQSTIQSATLYFYSDPAFSGSGSAEGNSQLSGSNAFYLEKITGEWDELSVTWNNQPATTVTDRLWVGPSTSTTEGRQINIQSLVQGWVNNPVSNNGLKMILESELYYRSRNYASTNHANAALRPKVVITYTAPAVAKTCETPDLTEAELMNLPWYGNEDYLQNHYDSLALIYGNVAARVPGHIESAWLKIPIKFWVYQIGPGNPGGSTPLPTERSLQRMIDNLNSASRLNGVNFRFYLQPVTFINQESAVNLNGYAEQQTLAMANRDNGAVNIHIVDSGTAGVNNILYNACFIPRSVGQTDTGAGTITHEVGHFFGLLHTHFGNGILCLREPVTRDRFLTFCPNGPGITKRCNWTGDLLCDTDADPDMSEHGTYTVDGCTWNANGKTDFRGDVYHPDARNYMAYGNHACRTHFSNGQKNVMHVFAFGSQFRPNWLPVLANQFDRHEPDDAAIAARTIPLGEIQTHSFHTAGRTDNEDWLRFAYSAAGSVYNYQLVLTQTTTNAAGVPEVYIEATAGVAGARVTGITSSTTGNVTTYTIPCANLVRGASYFVRVPRNQSGYGEYDIQLKTNMVNAMVLNGPVSLCYANATYTAQNVPAGATITWATGPQIAYVSGQGTTSYTVRATGSGISTIQYTVQNACGTAPAVVKNITLEAPATPIYGPQSVNDHRNVEYYATVPALSYEWAAVGGMIMYGQGSSTVGIKTDCDPSGELRVSVRITTTCGTSFWNTISVACYPEEHRVALLAFPNPAEGKLIVSTGTTDVKQIILRDVNRTVVDVTVTDAEAEIDVSNLPRGLYYLTVEGETFKKTQQIVVE